MTLDLEFKRSKSVTPIDRDPATDKVIYDEHGEILRRVPSEPPKKKVDSDISLRVKASFPEEDDYSFEDVPAAMPAQRKYSHKRRKFKVVMRNNVKAAMNYIGVSSLFKRSKRSARYDHLTNAPDPAKIDPLQVDAYYALIRTIGRTSLVGKGYEHFSYQDKRLSAFETLDDDLDARMWTEKDTMLSAMSDDERNWVLSSLFSQVLSRKHNMYDSNFSVKSSIPGALPQHVREFAELAADKMIPSMISYVQTLPEPLKQRPEAFLNLDFYNHLKDIHHYLTSPNLIETIEHDEFGQAVKVLTPSLSFAMESVSNKKAPYLMGKKSMLRFLDIRNYIPILRKRVRPLSYEVKYEKSSGVLRALATRYLGWKNKHLFDEEMVADFNLLNQSFKVTPQNLEAILRSARSLYQFHPSTIDEYNDVAKTVIRNAKRFGAEHALIGAHGHGTGQAYESSNKLHISFMRNLDSADPALLPLDSRSKAIISMYKTHHIAMEQYRGAVVAPLTRMRSGVVSKPEDNSYKTEGPLVRYGNYFEGTEKLLNNSFFFKLALTYKEKFHGYLDKAGSFLLSAFTSSGTDRKEQLKEITDFFDLGSHNQVVVRQNVTGRVYEIIGTELAFWVADKVYHNLKDNAPFFTPITAIKQITLMLGQGILNPAKIGQLLEDALKSSEIPDNPTSVRVYETDDVKKVFDRLRPAYLPHKGSFRSGLNGMLLTLAKGDFIDDNDNVPTLAAIGMLNSRRDDSIAARKFLGMTNNWAARAKELKLSAVNWDALASYEASVMHGMKGGEEDREEYLLKAFDAFAPLIEKEESPFYSNTRELERYCLLHPMNYKMRLELLYKSDSSFSFLEKKTIAHHARSELDTILESRGDKFQDGFKAMLQSYRDNFYQYEISINPPVLALKGGKNMVYDGQVIPDQTVSVPALGMKPDLSVKPSELEDAVNTAPLYSEHTPTRVVYSFPGLPTRREEPVIPAPAAPSAPHQSTGYDHLRVLFEPPKFPYSDPKDEVKPKEGRMSAREGLEYLDTHPPG